MFAGHPTEDLFEFSQSIGIPRSAALSRKSLAKLRDIKATIEHYRKKEDGGKGDPENIIAACSWCNGRRGNHKPMEWFEIVQNMVRKGTHPHWELIARESKTG